MPLPLWVGNLGNLSSGCQLPATSDQPQTTSQYTPLCREHPQKESQQVGSMQELSVGDLGGEGRARPPPLAPSLPLTVKWAQEG